MNPEFLRNLWLELPPHRMVAMPAVLVLVFFAAWLAGGSLSFASAAQGLIALLLVIWGSRLAAEAVLNEIIGRTWDNQRMSAVRPWDMTWGKLLGSTVFMWYGSLWCLVAFLVSPHGSVVLVIRLLLAGLEAQALALLFSMVLIRGEPVSLRFQVTVAQSLSVMVILPLLFITMFNRPESIIWYGYNVSFDIFVTLSQLAFIGWTVVGLYQMIRTELLHQAGPLTWLFFVVFSVAYIAGFDHLQYYTGRSWMPTLSVTRLFIAFCAAIALTYICALIESKSLVRLRRWLALLRDWRLAQGGQLSPSWIGTMVVALVLGMLTAVNIIGLRPPSAPLPLAPLAQIGAILAFSIRDLAIFHYLTLYSRSGRGELAIGIYLIFAYFLAPVLMSSARLDFLLPVLVPVPTSSAALAILPVLAEMLAAILVLVHRWQATRIEGLENSAGA
ncbi:MAG: hypothetical protein WCK65_07755 [Rhodospirillaceae bacterium]